MILRVKVVSTFRRGGLTENEILTAIEAQYPEFTTRVVSGVSTVDPTVSVIWHSNIADLPQNDWQAYPKCIMTVSDSLSQDQIYQCQRICRNVIASGLSEFVGGQGWTQLGMKFSDYGGA